MHRSRTRCIATRSEHNALSFLAEKRKLRKKRQRSAAPTMGSLRQDAGAIRNAAIAKPEAFFGLKIEEQAFYVSIFKSKSHSAEWRKGDEFQAPRSGVLSLVLFLCTSKEMNTPCA